MRRRITLINANTDQDHFQEQQIQIFAAASNTNSLYISTYKATCCNCNPNVM